MRLVHVRRLSLVEHQSVGSKEPVIPETVLVPLRHPEPTGLRHRESTHVILVGCISYGHCGFNVTLRHASRPCHLDAPLVLGLDKFTVLALLDDMQGAIERVMHVVARPRLLSPYLYYPAQVPVLWEQEINTVVPVASELLAEKVAHIPPVPALAV